MTSIKTFSSRSTNRSKDEIELWLSEHKNIEIKAVTQHVIGGKLRTWIFYEEK